MQKKIYRPRGVCSTQIAFEYEDGKIYNLAFQNGCNGNLKAISILLEGREMTEIVKLLEGNICGVRKTSCADQLVKAIKEVL